MNNRKTRRTIFSPILGILFFSGMSLQGCFSNPDLGLEDLCTSNYLSVDFKEHTIFKVGSYWVYRDDENSRIDSIYLYDYTVSLDSACGSSEIGNQTFIITHFATDQESGATTFISKDTLKVFFSAYERYNLYNDIDYINQPFFGFFGDGTYYEDPPSANFFFELIDSQIINGEIFTNIIAYDHDSEDYTFYWARNVGLVKKIYKSDFEGEDKVYDFELIRYHLSS